MNLKLIQQDNLAGEIIAINSKKQGKWNKKNMANFTKTKQNFRRKIFILSEIFTKNFIEYKEKL